MFFAARTSLKSLLYFGFCIPAAAAPAKTRLVIYY